MVLLPVPEVEGLKVLALLFTPGPERVPEAGEVVILTAASLLQKTVLGVETVKAVMALIVVELVATSVQP